MGVETAARGAGTGCGLASEGGLDHAGEVAGHPPMSFHGSTTSALPLVVQVAFAGARTLFDPVAHPAVDPAAFEQDVQRWLTDRLPRLTGDLRLTGRHRLSGLSSLAIGADSVFVRACHAAGWYQRVFLPQPREDFLAASGSKGPDFNETQAREARRLLDDPMTIEGKR